MIIPFFLMNTGCPRRCLFCNEQITAGSRPARIEQPAFAAAVRTFLAHPRRRVGPVQIAFYGGTFTGLPRTEQRRLLALAAPFLADGSVSGIRLSTRPDEINADDLSHLKHAGVTTVEVGAQSLDDDVLAVVQRGHTAADVVRAVETLKAHDFVTGLHLMVGLPSDDPARFAATIERTITLRPNTVRLHPTLVLRDTRLAEVFARGAYRPLTLPEAVNLCKAALKKLTAAGIAVIRLGLQSTAELEAPGAVVAGPHHPAFGSLVESAWLGERAEELWSAPAVRNARLRPGSAAPGANAGPTFTVAPADLTAFLGPRRANISALAHRFGVSSLPVAADPALRRGDLSLTLNGLRFHANRAGRITVTETGPVASPRGTW